MRWSLLLVGICGVTLIGCSTSSDVPAIFRSGAQVKPGVKSLFSSGKPLMAKQPSKTDTRSASQPSTDPEQGQLAFARLCERRGETRQAEQIYRACLKDHPRNPERHHRLAVLAVQEGKFDEADEHFKAALDCAPPSAELLSDLGYTHYLQHRLEEAEKVLREALAKERNHAAATTNLGLVLGAQGRIKESLVLFKRVGSEAEAHANLAYVLAQHGQLQQAQDAYLRALTLEPGMRVAAEAMLQVAHRRESQTALALRRIPAPPASAPSAPAPTAAEATPASLAVVAEVPTRVKREERLTAETIAASVAANRRFLVDAPADDSATIRANQECWVKGPEGWVKADVPRELREPSVPNHADPASFESTAPAPATSEAPGDPESDGST